MKLPNGLGTYQTREEALNALAAYNQNPYNVDIRKLTFAEVYEPQTPHPSRYRRLCP